MRFVVGLLVWAALGLTAIYGDVITPVGVLGTSEFGAVDVFGDGNLSDVFVIDLIDGMGLTDIEGTPDNILDDVHDNDWGSANGWHAGDQPAGLPGGVDGDDDWLTPPEVAKQVVEFDLGGLYELSTAHVWQQNQAALFFPPAPAETRGVDEFEILTSPAATGDDFNLVGKFRLEPETGTEAVPAQVIAFPNAPVTARRVRFHMLSAVGGMEFEYVGLSEVRFEGTAGGVTGDFDGDGDLTVADINALSAAVRAGNAGAEFDVNGDGTVSAADRNTWVEEIKRTWFGDANLDGIFDTSDFVQVFQAGEYEDGTALNSQWQTGDWNGDGEFDSGDFVTAFQGGGFEIGPRPAVAAVPEPCGWTWTGTLLACVACRWRAGPHRRRRSGSSIVSML
jgi:hypothetical protein